MKHFLEFSLVREQKIFNTKLGFADSSSYLSKFVKNKNQTVSFLKPRLLALSGGYFPALLLSNGSLIFLGSEFFGKVDHSRAGTLLFEDSYSEKEQ